MKTELHTGLQGTTVLGIQSGTLLSLASGLDLLLDLTQWFSTKEGSPTLL